MQSKTDTIMKSHLLKYVGWISDFFLAAMTIAYLVFIFLAREQFNTVQLIIFFGLGLIAVVVLARAIFKQIASLTR